MTSHSNAPAMMSLVTDDRSSISVGNAVLTGPGHGGWFVGNFLPNEAGIRQSAAVEVKWGLHMPEDARSSVNDCAGVYSLAILIDGAFVLEFPTLGEEVVLSQAGDYVLYGPDVPHSWRAIDTSTVLTIRWDAPESR
jgi:hypothetical protein